MATVVATPLWLRILRIVQVVFAVVLLGLLAYETSIYNNDGFDIGFMIGGFGVGLTAAIITILLGVYFVLSQHFIKAPSFHHWIIASTDLLLAIFWLVTWALLAKTTAWLKDVEDVADYYEGSGGICDYDYYYSFCYKKRSVHSFQKRDITIGQYRDIVETALALSLIEWFLFVATLVFTILSITKLRRENTAAAGTAPAAGTNTVDAEAQNQPMPAMATNPTYEAQPAVQQPVYHGETTAPQPMH